MTAIVRPAIVVVGLFTLLVGFAVPLAMTGIAEVAFSRQAGGSLIMRGERVVGSALIGQNFTGEQWFHPRPSATTEADPDHPGQTRPAPYNGAASAASQLGPASAALRASIRERVAGLGRGPVPADAATASASGLDPHISPENARRQVARVASARSLPEARVAALVAAHTEGRELGLLGAPRVNVFQLNLALDALR